MEHGARDLIACIRLSEDSAWKNASKVVRIYPASISAYGRVRPPGLWRYAVAGVKKRSQADVMAE
jgi:hypothetical protein